MNYNIEQEFISLESLRDLLADKNNWYTDGTIINFAVEILRPIKEEKK